MRRLLDRLLDAAARFGAPADSPSDWRPVQAIGILAVFVGVLLAAFYASIFWWFDQPVAAALSTVTAILIVLVLARLHVTRDLRASTFRMAVIILLFPLLCHIALGGFLSSGGLIVWTFIAPVFVLVFEDVRRAVPWFVAFVAVILASPLVPTLRPSTALPEGVVLTLFAFTLSAMAANVFLVLGIFAAQRASALATAQEERRRADQLIEAMLPVAIAERLKGGARRIAEHYQDTTIVFADVVGFTEMTARLDPDDLVELLDALFRRFDGLVDRHGIEKIKTVGDSYMVASGAPIPRNDHAHVAARFALDLLAAVATAPDGTGAGSPVARPELRVGMHSGPVVGGVLGRRRPIYDLWGDTVNIASRMESQGVPGRIQISRTTRDLIESEFTCVERGMLEVRGRGPIDTWFLVGPKEA